MDDSYLEKTKPAPAEAVPLSNRKSRVFRAAVKRAVKKAKKLVRRNLTPDELQMIKDEVAKYA